MLSACLTQSNDTGFSFSGRSKVKDKYWMDDMYVPVIFKSHGLLEGSDQIEWIHIEKLENPGACITEYQISSQFSDDWFMHEPDIFSTKDQINLIRKIMGLNISDIATFLRVSRLTVYQWLDTEISVRNSHQERLNDIYDICLSWNRKKMGSLNAYLYKKPNNTSKSLIEMLAEDQLDKNKIHYLLNQIEQSIFARKAGKDKNQKLLKQHDFEDISEEEIEKNFQNNIQSIG